VNCVAPGFTITEGVEQHPEVVEKLREVSIASRTIQATSCPRTSSARSSSSAPRGRLRHRQTMVIDGGQFFH